MAFVLLGGWWLAAACGAPRREGTNPPAPPAAATRGGSAGEAGGVAGSAADSMASMAIDEIRYQLSGGIAGFDLELRLGPGGAFTVVEAGHPERRGRLAAAEWSEVTRLVVAARMVELAPRYGTPGAVADAFHEVVTVTGGGKTIAIASAGDPRDEPPPGFRDLANRLREIAMRRPD